MTWVRVLFHGQSLWIEEAALSGESDSPLSPESHVRDGELDFPACFASESYAHVWGGVISRYGAKVGTVADLVRLPEAAPNNA